MAALPGNLDGTRVLDLTREPGFFAGKLLGDLGADVVKIEPPAGDPARRRPPFWGDATDPERAIVWLALNTSKRGITLDLERDPSLRRVQGQPHDRALRIGRVAPERRAAARRVAGRGLDLHDVCTEVAEQLAREEPGLARQVEHAGAIEVAVRRGHEGG